MKKLIALVLMGVLMTGCQPKPQEPQVNMETQRKEAAKKLFAQSVILLHNKDLKGAVASLEASIKVDPTDPNPYLVLGQILLKAEEYDHAVEFLDNAAKNFPNNGTIFYMLGISNRMNKQILPAVLAARRSLEIFKTTGDEVNAQASAALLAELIKEAQAIEAAQKGEAQPEAAVPTKG